MFIPIFTKKFQKINTQIEIVGTFPKSILSLLGVKTSKCKTITNEFLNTPNDHCNKQSIFFFYLFEVNQKHLETMTISSLSLYEQHYIK